MIFLQLPLLVLKLSVILFVIFFSYNLSFLLCWLVPLSVVVDSGWILIFFPTCFCLIYAISESVSEVSLTNSEKKCCCVYLGCSIIHKDSGIKYWGENLKRTTSDLSTFPEPRGKKSLKTLPTLSCESALSVSLASLWLIVVS